MSKTVAVPDDLYQKAAEAAARQRVSIEEFVSAALANQIASGEYIESRATLFRKEEYESALRLIPDVDPEEHDRL